MFARVFKRGHDVGVFGHFFHVAFVEIGKIAVD